MTSKDSLPGLLWRLSFRGKVVLVGGRKDQDSDRKFNRSGIKISSKPTASESIIASLCLECVAGTSEGEQFWVLFC